MAGWEKVKHLVEAEHKAACVAIAGTDLRLDGVAKSGAN